MKRKLIKTCALLTSLSVLGINNLQPLNAQEQAIVRDTKQDKTRLFEFNTIFDEKGRAIYARGLSYGTVYPIDTVEFAAYAEGVEIPNILIKTRDGLYVDTSFTSSIPIEIRQKNVDTAPLVWGSDPNNRVYMLYTAGKWSIGDSSTKHTQFKMRSWSLKPDAITNYQDISTNDLILGLYRQGEHIASSLECDNNQIKMDCLFSNLNPFETYQLKVVNPDKANFRIKNQGDNGQGYSLAWLRSNYSVQLSADKLSFEAFSNGSEWGTEQDFLEKTKTNFELYHDYTHLDIESLEEIGELVQFELYKDGHKYNVPMRSDEIGLKMLRLEPGNYELMQVDRNSSVIRTKEPIKKFTVNDKTEITNIDHDLISYIEVIPVRSLSAFSYTNGLFAITESDLTNLKIERIEGNETFEAKLELVEGTLNVVTDAGVSDGVYNVSYSLTHGDRYENVPQIVNHRIEIKDGAVTTPDDWQIIHKERVSTDPILVPVKKDVELQTVQNHVSIRLTQDGKDHPLSNQKFKFVEVTEKGIEINNLKPGDYELDLNINKDTLSFDNNLKNKTLEFKVDDMGQFMGAFQTISIESKDDVKPEVKPEVQPEVKPEVKPEEKPEVNPEVTPELKPEGTSIPETDKGQTNGSDNSASNGDTEGRKPQLRVHEKQTVLNQDADKTEVTQDSQKQATLPMTGKSSLMTTSSIMIALGAFVLVFKQFLAKFKN